MVRAERERRKLSLNAFALDYHDKKESGADIHPSMLSMLETGKREGDPQTWAGLWQFLGLPWNELYREWGLPTPGGTVAEDVEVAEIAHAVARLDSPRRQVVARFVSSLDYLLQPVAVLTNPLNATPDVDVNHERNLNSAAPEPEGVHGDGKRGSDGVEQANGRVGGVVGTLRAGRRAAARADGGAAGSGAFEA
jgi:hypothetical protein